MKCRMSTQVCILKGRGSHEMTNGYYPRAGPINCQVVPNFKWAEKCTNATSMCSKMDQTNAQTLESAKCSKCQMLKMPNAQMSTAQTVMLQQQNKTHSLPCALAYRRWSMALLYATKSQNGWSGAPEPFNGVFGLHQLPCGSSGVWWVSRQSSSCAST